MIKVSDQFTLLIDYAHNAMALESLLTTLREYEPHRLVSLFGCGGNRSRQRRFEMGEVSGRLADLTIITSDNPRFEEPQDIINDIKTGMAKTDGKYVEICDRKEAITYAIEHGEPGDIIVLAGKGHEDYQEIKGVKHPMDERDLIRDILMEDISPDRQRVRAYKTVFRDPGEQKENRLHTLYADIIVDISLMKLDKTFQYRIPERLRDRLEPGACVMIPFRQ